ncbi:MAG: tetratricopeptide repeat protein [Calditrichota bacterium]
MSVLALSAAAAKNEFLNKAREAARQEEWEQAAQFAQQAVEQEPKNEDAWSVLGDTQMGLGDSSSAVSSWEKALSLNAKLPSAVLSLTRFYLDANRINNAEQVVASAEEKDKKGRYDEIKVARGMIFASSGNMAEATKVLMSATAKNPKNPLYPQILARIYAGKQVYDLAEKYYADAWALDEGNPSIAFEYGVVLQAQKRYKEALDLFKVVQEKDPNNKTVDYLVGRLYFAAGRYAEAAKQFETAVEKRPDHFLSILLLGRSYMELSKQEKINFYGQACNWLEKAHGLKPDREDVTLLLADAKAQQGRMFYLQGAADTTGLAPAFFDSALTKTKEALVLNPDQPNGNSQISRIFDKMGLLDSAVVYSQIQMQQSPDDRTEFARLVNLNQRMNRQSDLIALLQPVMEDTGYFNKYVMILANAQIETNNYSEARKTIGQIIERDPTNCDAHQLNAYVDLKRERYAEAIPALRAGVQACPKDANMWVYLGDCLYFSDPKKKDTVKQAKDAYTRACELGSRDGCEKKEQITELLKTLR